MVVTVSKFFMNDAPRIWLYFVVLLLDALWCRKCENVFTLDDCTCSVECAAGEVSTFYNYYFYTPNGGGVVDNTLDYQSRDRDIPSPASPVFRMRL